MPASGVSGNFPGQAGNPVGFAAAPGYPGSLTLNNGTSIVAGNTYSFQDFFQGINSAITVANVTFTGCRFQGNGASGAIVSLNTGASNINFNYSTLAPTGSPSIPNTGWPTGSSGLQINSGLTGYQAATIPYLSGYQFAINEIDASGDWTMDHCDIWGFANAISLGSPAGRTAKFQDCWFHDPRYDNGTDHTDIIGYLNGGSAAIAGVTADHCTMAGMGNTNLWAMQAAGSYNLIRLTRSYLSGFGNMLDMGSLSSATPTNVTITDNVLGTDIPFGSAFFRGDQSALLRAGANLYRRNILKVRPGTSPLVGSNPQWLTSQDGQFVYPDNTTISTTDFS